MGLQCQTFALDIEGLPSVDDLINLSDPEQQAKLYREAGLSKLADNVGPLQQARAAARNFVELPAEDYALYADYLTEEAAPSDCTIPPPDEAVTVLITARKYQWFTRIAVRSHAATGESLLLGIVESNAGTRYFKLAHWGEHLTAVEELHKRRRFARTAARQINAALAWRPQFKWLQRRNRGRDRHGSSYFVAVTLLAACASWALIPAFGSWWLFAGVFTALMIGCGMYAESKADYSSIEAVYWVIGINAVAGLVTGGLMLNTYNTKNTTQEVLVCGAHQRNNTGVKEWYVVTSKGHMTPVAGFYNGTYFSGNNEAAAKSLVGKWVRVTIHGRVGMDSHPPYITKADALRDGNCG